LLPVLLSFKGKKVVIFGCGSVGTRRAKKILKNGGMVDIYSKEFSEEIKSLKDRCDNLNLIKLDIEKLSDDELKKIITKYDFVITAIDPQINRKIVKIALSLDKFVNSSTNEEEINFIIPACTEVDGVIFSIYTGGKSPLIARNIRIIVENYLKSTDLEGIAKFRDVLKEIIPNPKDRKKILEDLLKNEKFREDLKNLIEKWV